ncbi:MAG: thermonuclease family protein [Candidatus Omnitrophica bacterium]|nr:thermonuclease family protein [Candidatus Omnitrophota bacterium]
MNKKLAKTDGYKILVSKIREELGGLELLIKRETVLRYWRVGKYISQHLLENKERAGYGDHLYERLSLDTERDKATLWRMTQFHRTFPILAHGRELNWRSYRALLTVKDDTKRRQLERKAAQEDWKSEQLIKHIKDLRQKEEGFKPLVEIPQLAFTRGRLNSYRLLEPELLPTGQQSSLLIDLGFQMRREFSESESLGLKVKAGECIKVVQKGKTNSFEKISIPEEELFTYRAAVKKIIDGDTLWALIDCGFGRLIRQKLRLRGIDCPELSTTEGQRAKRFVQEKLKNLDFIIIKTYKDTVDKYDRYLSDLFYSRDEKDPQKVLEEGTFLNQELLDKGLAKIMED